jgi:hypothetical protein
MNPEVKSYENIKISDLVNNKLQTKVDSNCKKLRLLCLFYTKVLKILSEDQLKTAEGLDGTYNEFHASCLTTVTHSARGRGAKNECRVTDTIQNLFQSIIVFL